MRQPFVPLLIAAALAPVQPALAQPALLSSTPAADARVAQNKLVQLTFSEPVTAAHSGAQVFMTGMPGMANHAPMRMAGTAALGADRRMLTISFARPLPKGSYRVDWYAVAVAGDTRRATGSIAFTVG